MNNKILILSSWVLLLGAVASCSEMNPHPMDMSQAVQSASSKADHEALAKHYDEAAAEMQAKADEQKKMLGHYESKSYLYGRHAEDIEEHCQALIRAYENAAEANRKLAATHRALAQ